MAVIRDKEYDTIIKVNSSRVYTEIYICIYPTPDNLNIYCNTNLFLTEIDTILL